MHTITTDTTPTTPTTPITTPWEGDLAVCDREGQMYVGWWVENETSTHGRWFLHLRDSDGAQATGFGGLTPEEAAAAGLRVEDTRRFFSSVGDLVSPTGERVDLPPPLAAAMAGIEASEPQQRLYQLCASLGVSAQAAAWSRGWVVEASDDNQPDEYVGPR